MTIQVLGSGCPKCKKLHENVKEVAKDLNLEAKIDYSTDVSKIVELGSMSSPVLVINEEVEVEGESPSKEELKEILSKYQEK